MDGDVLKPQLQDVAQRNQIMICPGLCPAPPASLAPLSPADGSPGCTEQPYPVTHGSDWAFGR